MDLGNIIERVGFAGGLLFVFWWYLKYSTSALINTVHEWRKESQREHQQIMASLQKLAESVEVEEEDAD